MLRTAWILAGITLLAAGTAEPQSYRVQGPEESTPFEKILPKVPAAPLFDYSKYDDVARKHRMNGRACYYAGFFEGRKTASGEIFRHRRFTAAHLTLPLGTWLEVESVATGKAILVKVNDRGPYSGGFILDLSKSAARELGVDRARDRRVTMKIVALPGEEPPERVQLEGGGIPHARAASEP